MQSRSASTEAKKAKAAARIKIASPRDPKQRLVGEGAAMQQVRRAIDAVAPLASTVLITGETGTGKGLAARELHDRSPRRSQPFVHVDCSSLAGSVIESELFGHEHGAFTGAAGARAGRFETASAGTLFLDEVGELTPDLQAKLLRVLQDGVYERVGSSQERVMSARVIAATHRDLDSAVATGRFRRDLYFRLHVFCIEMPPLRERLEDLPDLVESGIERLALRLGVSEPPIPSSFYEYLAARDWPGNVRELMNVLERLLIQHHAGLRDAMRDCAGLAPTAPGPRPHRSALPSRGREEERAVLKDALVATGGNVSRAARRLGIARSTLRYRIALFDLAALIPSD